MIKGADTKDGSAEEDSFYDNWGVKLITPLAVLLMFFAGCVTVSLYLEEEGGIFAEHRPKMGIYYLFFIAIVFMLYNGFVLTPQNLRAYIRGKKYGWAGVILVLAVGAIVFGFLDNFGMKLGTDALEESFLKWFSGPLSKHKEFPEAQKSIQENIIKIGKWSGSSEWPRIVNQVTRHLKDEGNDQILADLINPDQTREIKGKFAGYFNELFNNSANASARKQDFMNSVGHFLRSLELKEKSISEIALTIPKQVELDNNIGIFVKACKEKYSIIDDSKAMLGNTFSDFIGALLGAAVANLFTYLTANDGMTLAMNIPDGLTIAGPVIEAFFIAFGCLIPIYINIAMKNFEYDNNFMPTRSVGVVCVGMIILFGVMIAAASPKESWGVTPLSDEEKETAIRNNITDIIDRTDFRGGIDISVQSGETDIQVIVNTDEGSVATTSSKSEVQVDTSMGTAGFAFNCIGLGVVILMMLYYVGNLGRKFGRSSSSKVAPAGTGASGEWVSVVP